MNNNVNNNDQEMILRAKIEKREKIDTILAYVLIVVLLACIGIVLGLKFFGEEETPPVEEYTPTYISLGEIATSLNSSILANRYMNDGATLSAAINGNALLVSYIKDENIINLNMPLVGNELMISVPEENSNIIMEIYKEIANIICMYYGNEEKYCRYTLNYIGDNGTEGIKFDNNGNTKIIYIDTTKSYNIESNIVYNTVTISDINDTNYTLELNNIRISNIEINNTNTNMTFNGNIEKLNEDNSDTSVLIKLYDINNNLLGENKQEFNSDNVLENSGLFEVSFLLSDTLKTENINKYSIEIIK